MVNSQPEISLSDTRAELSTQRVEPGSEQGWTLVGGIDSPNPARVSSKGLVTAHGSSWSIDWWIGTGERWYYPERESSVRQTRMGPGPVLETKMNTSEGEVSHTVHSVRVGAKDLSVLEVTNNAKTPLALALAVRPCTVDGIGSVGPAAIAGDTVLVQGQTALICPKLISELLSSDEGLVIAFALPHKTSLRFVVPEAELSRKNSHTYDGHKYGDIGSLPSAEAGVKGWNALVTAAGKVDLGDSHLSNLVGAARARLLIEADQLGDKCIGFMPGAGLELEALASFGHATEVGVVIGEFSRSFPTRLNYGPPAASEVLAAVSVGVLLRGDAEISESVLEAAVQAAKLIEHSGDKLSTVQAFGALRNLLSVAGREIPEDLALGDSPVELANRYESLTNAAAKASPSLVWGANEGDSARGAAEFLQACRRVLLDNQSDQVDILPEFPNAWRGGSLEVHEMPISGGFVSFAIRWHGARPALLWECSRPNTTLRCSGLDPSWETSTSQGETLLAGDAGGLAEPPSPGSSFI